MSLRSKLGIFVLTAEEQRTIAFIVLAFVLGLATQHYRRHHSRPVSSTKLEGAANDTSSAGKTPKALQNAPISSGD
jgi:hypothetical protein